MFRARGRPLGILALVFLLLAPVTDFGAVSTRALATIRLGAPALSQPPSGGNDETTFAVFSAAPTTTTTATATPSPSVTPSHTPTVVVPTATPVASTASSLSVPTENVDAQRQLRLPILMYHYIRVNPDPSDRIGYGLSVPPAEFAAQMDLLAGRGYQTVGLADAVGYLRGERAALPPRAIVLTFDDGYADFYSSAYPVLRKYGFRATVFMITGLIDRPGYLSWSQLKELAAGGIIVGSHTVRHADLTRLSRQDLATELGESKSVLEHALGQPVLDFGYPSGRYNSQVVAAVAAAGYRAATTVEYGITHRSQDLLTLRRVRISGGQSLGSIAAAAGLEAKAP